MTIDALCLLSLLAAPAGPAPVPSDPPAATAPGAAASAGSPAEQLAAAARDGADIKRTFYDELDKAGNDMPKVSAANKKYRDASGAWAKAARALVARHPAEPAALDVLLVMADIYLVDDDQVQILHAHHFPNPKVLGLMNDFAQRPASSAQRRFAEDVADKHPDRAVRGRATLALGRLDRIYLIDAAKPEPSFGGRLGPPETLRPRARAFLERVAKDYADVTSDGDGGATLGDLAKAELTGLDHAGRLEVGNVAPDIAGEDLDGRPLAVPAKSGKVTVLVFWGSWCGPCMRMVPREAALVAKYKDRPFQLVGVNGGDDRDKAKRAAADKKMTWPSFFSGKGQGGLAAAWNVDAWPAVWVIGPDGVIRYKGYDEDKLEAAVEAAMAQVDAAGRR